MSKRQLHIRDDKIGVTVAGKRHTYKPGAVTTILLSHLRDVFGAGILKDADGDGVLPSDVERPSGEYAYERVSQATETSCMKKVIPKNMPIMDGKLTCRVSRLERDSKCIGTAIRVSKQGIIMTTRLAKDDMENVKEITAFGGSLVLIRDYDYKFCFFKGEEGEAFDIAPFRTFGVTHELDLVSYPLRRIRNKLHLEVSKGVVEDIDSTGYYGTLTLADSKDSFPFGGAIVVGEKLLLGMHIGTSRQFITSWMIRHFLGEFDKRYDEPIKVPLVKRSR